MITPESPEILEETLKSAGFEKMPEGKELEASFSLVNIYHVRGIALQENGNNTLADLCHKHQDFAFGFGNSLNEICQYLFDEDFDDEEKWKKVNNINPPYSFLVIYIGLDKTFACESDIFKSKELGKIITFNSFSEVKDTLKDKESKIIPKLITSLSTHFSCPDKPIQFIPISRKIHGKTNLGDVFDDLEIQGSGNIFTFTSIHPAEVKVRIEESIKSYNILVNILDDQVGILFHAALGEDNKFMKFLNFFLVLERYTNKMFEKWKRTINRAAIIIPDEIKKKGKITTRFYQCTKSLWKAVDDEDIDNFILMKDIRNDIAHGNSVNETEFPIGVAERLCLKILSIKIDP